MIIKLQDIKVFFSGVKALDGVTVNINPGEVHGLIGENGAGKSTTMNVLSGGIKPTSGQVLVDGIPVTFTKAADAVKLGISLVSQEGSLVAHLSAAANICLGFEPVGWGGVIRRKEMTKVANELLLRWFPNSRINLSIPVGELPYASQKIVEILRALHAQPKVVILDEPTATLPAVEKSDLCLLIRKLAQEGVAVVIISHFMSEILEMSDRITALQDGKVVCSLANKELCERDLVGFMLNRGVTNKAATLYEQQHQRVFIPVGDRHAIHAKSWIGKGFNVDSFAAEPGEIVGLIGLTGSGHTEFANSLYQPRLATSGHLTINDKDCSNWPISRMKAAGVALVPDHRMTNALLGQWTVRENLSLINISSTATRFLGMVMRRAEHAKAREVGKALNVKMSSVDQKVAELSGGNKQKVSIGRWLFATQEHADLFIFIEPTEGVDIGSKREIHDLMRRLSAQGAAVIVVSSDLLEISAVADRVVPFNKGRSGRSILHADFSEQLFIDYIAGVAA
jgi:ribose transport system ATP-binding protein